MFRSDTWHDNEHLIIGFDASKTKSGGSVQGGGTDFVLSGHNPSVKVIKLSCCK